MQSLNCSLYVQQAPVLIGHFLVNLGYFLLRSVGPELPAVQEVVIELYLVGLGVLLNGELAVDLAEAAVLAAREEQPDVGVLEQAERGQLCGELRLFQVEEGGEEGGVVLGVLLHFCEGGSADFVVEGVAILAVLLSGDVPVDDVPAHLQQLDAEGAQEERQHRLRLVVNDDVHLLQALELYLAELHQQFAYFVIAAELPGPVGDLVEGAGCWLVVLALSVDEVVGGLADELGPVGRLHEVLEVAVNLVDGLLDLPLVVELSVCAVEHLGLDHGFRLGQVEGVLDLLGEELVSAVEEVPAEGAVEVLQDVVVHAQQVADRLYVAQVPLLFQHELAVLVLLVDVDPDGDGLLLVVDLFDVSDVGPEVDDDGGVGQRQSADAAGHGLSRLALQVDLLALLGAVADDQLYQMPLLLLVLPQVLLAHQPHLELHLLVQLILIKIMEEVVDMGFEAFDVVLDICASALVGEGEGDEAGAGPGVEELLVDVQLDHLLDGADARNVVRFLAQREELIEDGEAVLLAEVLLDLGELEVGDDEGLEVLLKERLDCLTGVVAEEAVFFLVGEDAVGVDALHDEDVVADVEAHALAQVALALLEDEVELAQVEDDVLEDCDLHQQDALPPQDRPAVLARVDLDLQEGPPVGGYLLVLLVDQRRLLLHVHPALLVGQVESLGFLALPPLVLDEEVVVLVVVELLDHLVDQEHVFEGVEEVLVLVAVEVGEYLVHDDLCLAAEDALIFLLLVGALLGQRLAAEQVLVLGVVGVQREEQLEVVLCDCLLKLVLPLEFLEEEAGDEDVEFLAVEEVAFEEPEVAEDVEEGGDGEGEVEDHPHGYLVLHVVEHALLVLVDLEDALDEGGEVGGELFDEAGDVVAHAAETGVVLRLLEVHLQEDGGEEDVVVVLDLDGRAFVDLLQAALEFAGLALNVLQADRLVVVGGGGGLLCLAVFCEFLFGPAAFDGLDEFEVGVEPAGAVLVGGLLDVLAGVAGDIIFQFLGLNVGGFLGVEVGLFEVLGLLLPDGGDVVGDDDDLAVPELLHELVLHVLHELAVLDLQDLLAVVEDNDRVGLALLRQLPELVHFPGDEVLLLESELQEGLDVAAVLVLEVHREVLGEDLAVHDVDPRLLHEIGLARELFALQEEVRDALVVGEVLLDEGEHLALHPQDVVFAQAF